MTRPFHEEVLIGRLSKAIRSAKPSTLSVQGHHEFNLEESLHNIQGVPVSLRIPRLFLTLSCTVSLLMLQSVKLLFPLKPSFVLASLRRFVLDKVEVREPHLLFRHDVLPNLRTLGPGDYYQIVVVDQDDKEEDSDYHSDDSDVDPRRELKMDTTDYPLVPQLQAFSSRSVSATIRTTAIAVLDTCFFDAEADTLPTSLRVLRLVACDEQKFEEQLTDFLYTQPPLPLLEEVHFIAYKGENEETWTSAHDWCEAQNVELHIDDPEDLSGRGDPSL